MATDFLRLLSATTHSTSSRRQLVHGEPFSTTSQRTLRARQQQQAFDALLLTGRAEFCKLAALDLRLFLDKLLSGDSGDETMTTNGVPMCYCMNCGGTVTMMVTGAETGAV